MTGNQLDSEQLALLEQDRGIIESYIEDVDKIPTEDKIMAMYEEESVPLTPWDIDVIVQEALAKLGDVITIGNTDKAYEVIYEAVSEAVHSKD